MDRFSVDEFLASYNIAENAIDIVGISDRSTRQPDSLILLDDYLRKQGVDEQGVKVARPGWVFGLSKWGQPKPRSLNPSKGSQQNRIWMWMAIVLSEFWLLTWLSLPARAQCHEDVTQNWLQLSIELITESFKL